MDRERAETYLRLLAEAELRRATTMAARSSSGRRHSARLALAARALSAVGAGGAGAADLPGLDSAQITIIGLHHGERGTIMHLLVSGVTLEEEWAYARGVRPLPVLWIRDSDGRWHATDLDGVSPCGDTGVTIISMRLVPPLDHGTTWIQITAAGPSAQVLATLPLSPQRPPR